MLLVGCSVQVTAGNGNPAEAKYAATLHDGVNNVNTASQGLHPVCDKGGNKTACYQASTAVISAIDTFEQSFVGLDIPSRFSVAHADLVAALKVDKNGFVVRDQALEGRGGKYWTQGNDQIHQGVELLQKALAEYPKSS